MCAWHFPLECISPNLQLRHDTNLFHYHILNKDLIYAKHIVGAVQKTTALNKPAE